MDLYVVGGRGGGVPLKLGVISLGEPTKSWMPSLRYAPSGVPFPPTAPRTRGDVTPGRGDLRSAGRGGTGLAGAGDEEYSANCSTSSSVPSSSKPGGGESAGEKSGGRGGAGSSGGGGPSTMEGGDSGGGGDPGESGGGEGGGSSGGGPGERPGVEGVDEGVSGAGESGGGGGGAGSSGGGGLSLGKVTHLGDAVSSQVRGPSAGPNTSSRSGPPEPR